MRHIAAIAVVVSGLSGLSTAPLAAEDWQSFADDAALRAFLIAHPIAYETGAWQQFNASGRTLYRYGETSWGYWRIEGGRYCSQWPPGEAWDCYDVSFDGADALRFVDDWGNASIGTVTE